MGNTWPPLPDNGGMRGRPAALADIDSGQAIFSQATEGNRQPGVCKILIPQYGLWKGENDAPLPVFVMQAEFHVNDPDGEPLFGLRTFDGEEIVASGEEVELLGPSPFMSRSNVPA